MLLADSSAWIEWLRARGSSADLALHAALADDEVILLEPVKAELLTGARDREELGTLRRLLETVDFAVVHPRDDFESAVELFHTARRHGVAARGLMDCLIAAMALRLRLPILHHDRDFARMAAAIGLPEAAGSLASS